MGYFISPVLFVTAFEVMLIAAMPIVGVWLQSGQINSPVRSYKDDLMSIHQTVITEEVDKLRVSKRIKIKPNQATCQSRGGVRWDCFLFVMELVMW